LWDDEFAGEDAMSRAHLQWCVPGIHFETARSMGGMSEAMKKVLVLGAGGQIARWVIEMLKNNHDVELTLFLRRLKRLKGDAPKNSKVVRGDVLNKEQLNHAMVGQDIAYANLSGDDIDLQAKNIVQAMDAAGVRRLIFVASLGIYDEVPGKFGAWNRREIGAYLLPFRRAADAIEASRSELHDIETGVANGRRRSGL
jgi:uncharacterized protein YbjT (DUF2867 family)